MAKAEKSKSKYLCPTCGDRVYIVRTKLKWYWPSHVRPGTIELCPASGKSM